MIPDPGGQPAPPGEHYQRMAEALADQAGEMVDAWRVELAGHPHLAVYSAHPDGTPTRSTRLLPPA